MQTESGPSDWMVGKDMLLKETWARLDLTPEIEGGVTGQPGFKNIVIKKKKLDLQIDR